MATKTELAVCPLGEWLCDYEDKMKCENCNFEQDGNVWKDRDGVERSSCLICGWATKVDIGTPKPKVVVICGSSKFVDLMAVSAWLLEKDEGVIAMGLHLLPVWYSAERIPDHLAEHEGVADAMDDLHKRKIDIADEIFVVNHDDYIGDSTRSEIEYAKTNGVFVRWYSSDSIGHKVKVLLGEAVDRSKSLDARRCRVCGCTDDDCLSCVERTGEPCWWVEDDLCSACR